MPAERALTTDGAAIGCIVTLYNGARFIASAIESLCRQTRPPAEIVVIDDGSTDDGAARAKAAGGDLVRIVRQSNAGVPLARNRGLAESRAPLVSFLDHDDLASPERLERLSDALLRDPSCEAIFGRWRNFWMPELGGEEADPGNAHHRGEQASPLLTAALFRREVFDRVGGFDPAFRYKPELRWMLSAMSQGMRRMTIPDVVLERRIHGSNFSREGASPMRAHEIAAILADWHVQRKGRAGATERNPAG